MDPILSLTEARDRFAQRHPERRISLNGRDWGLTVVGQGRVLVLLPGTLGRGDVFFQQIEALQDRLRILALSYPASGGIADWTADIRAILAHENVSDFAVLGSSLGGYLAQYLAAACPGKVGVLMAANTLHSALPVQSQQPYASDVLGLPIAELRAGFHRGLDQWQATHPEHANMVALLLAEADGRIPAPELRARLNALKTAPELPAVSVKAVTIESDDDPLIPPPMRQAVRDRLRPAAAYVFATGGHFPYLVRPGDYTAVIEREMGLGDREDVPGLTRITGA